MSPKSRTLLLVFALLGLGASSVSSYVHYRLLTQPNYESFCDVGSRVNCTQAYLSQYGSFGGVPVALAGVIFFGIVLAIAGLAGRPASPARENAAAYVFVLSTVGLAFALYLAWASYFVLEVFCVLCAITYVAVIALFIISGGAASQPMSSLPRRAARDLRTLVSSPVALVTALAIMGGSVALLAAFPSEADGIRQQSEAAATYQPLTPEQRKQVEDWWDVQPVVDVPVPKADGTQVQIVKFSDYQCPACRSAHDALKPVLAKYRGQGVQFVMKHYPLEAECNPQLGGGNHYGSCEAAAAYEMAKGTPHLEKLDDWLFQNQSTLNKDVARKAAQDIAGITDYDARYQAVLETVKEDAALGRSLNVNSTPTIFINGRRIPGVQPPAVYDAMIEIALKKR
ncbi:MAG TPA: vitamin K epoxide reductase family protein [Vicinamibacterales bacterium]|nr:vitamin K epoxide reductase family protein [Vicinamibacterales bacterium]